MFESALSSVCCLWSWVKESGIGQLKAQGLIAVASQYVPVLEGILVTNLVLTLGKQLPNNRCFSACKLVRICAPNSCTRKPLTSTGQGRALYRHMSTTGSGQEFLCLPWDYCCFCQVIIRNSSRVDALHQTCRKWFFIAHWQIAHYYEYNPTARTELACLIGLLHFKESIKLTMLRLYWV